jgi:small-conductance mechanosensitive channel
MLLGSNHSWADKLENGFTAIFGFIPELIAALAILIIGYFVAKIVGNLIGRLLERAGLDRMLTSGQGSEYVSRVTRSPSRLLGRIAFWALFLGAVSLAVTALGINALTDFVGAIFAYLPNVIVALLIFLVAGAVAAAVGALVARTMGDTPTGKIVGSIAPVLIMVIAAFMILDQLRIAEDIVETTFQALMFGTALALALAFGLGGRDVAARMLEGAYEKGQENREQVRRDMQQGKERAREDLSRARDAAQGTTDEPAGSRAAR